MRYVLIKADIGTLHSRFICAGLCILLHCDAVTALYLVKVDFRGDGYIDLVQAASMWIIVFFGY